MIQRLIFGWALLLSSFLVSNPALSSETGNILGGNTSWDNCLASGANTWGNNNGGDGGYTPNCGPDQINFGWLYGVQNKVISQTVGINLALKEVGIQVDGFRYSWYIKNRNANQTDQGGVDTMIMSIDVYKANGDLYRSYEYDYSYDMDWTRFSGTELFNQNYLSPDFFGNMTVSAFGTDRGYWWGYFGPELANASINLIYSANPCYNNSLYDPSCDGYAEAYAQVLYDQNCAANPLYDTGCPGYATAYFNQQCTADALYSSACPGYAEAYFDQQCTLDPFYNTTCPGYAAAYYNQQCTLDTLYDSGCDGYESAYYEKYIKPQLEEQTAQASGTDTTSATSTNTSIPTVSSTGEFNAISLTGDSVVDSFISGGTANDMVASYTPAQESTPAPTETPQQSNGGETVGENQRETESSNEATTGEVSQNEPESESISDSSADVEEPMGDGGGEDSGGSEAGSDEKEDNATGGDSKPKSSSDSRRDKMKKAMTEKAMSLADDMSKAATVEAQKAVQAQVLAVMSYVPGFGSYGGSIGGGSYSDAQMYAPTTVPESKRGLRNGLAQQLLHTKMVDSQYKESD